MKKIITLFIILLSAGRSSAQQVYNELYRPQYHLTLKTNGLGDPCGLVKYQGVYYSHTWFTNTSTDMLHWKQGDWAMRNDGDSVQYWTGSVLVDFNNSAGLGTHADTAKMLALFTYLNHNLFGEGVPPQSQRTGMAISTDDYKHFDFYENNPIKDIGNPAWRDPYIFWHAPTSKWIMTMAQVDAHIIEFYSSTNLKEWEYLSNYSAYGSKQSGWECASMVELTVDGNSENKKWMLIAGEFPYKTQIFIGDFDGTNFTPDPLYVAYVTANTALWAEQSPDFYATKPWQDFDNPAAQPIWQAWLGNWDYVKDSPTKYTWGGTGVHSLPRKLSLKTDAVKGYRLVQEPIDTLRSLRKMLHATTNYAVSGTQDFSTIFAPESNVYEAEFVFDRTNAANENFGINFCVDAVGTDKVVLGFDANTSTVYFDRSNSGNVTFSMGKNGDNENDPTSRNYFLQGFCCNRNLSDIRVPVSATASQIKFRIFVDNSTVEVFINDGDDVISSVIFPKENSTGIQIFSNSGASNLASFKGWELGSVWSDPPSLSNQPTILYDGENVVSHWDQWNNLPLTNNAANPDKTGVNPSQHCISVTWQSGITEHFLGGWMRDASFNFSIDPSVYDQISLLVKKPVTGNVALHFQENGYPDEHVYAFYSGDIGVSGNDGKWQKLYFDISKITHPFSRIALSIHDYEIDKSDMTMYWDDLLIYPRAVSTAQDLPPVQVSLIAHYPMDLSLDKSEISDIITGNRYAINDHRNKAENKDGAVGQALRFDGYSTFINTEINTNNLSDKAISVSLWAAMENYPMIDIDGYLHIMTSLFGNLNDEQKSGFAFVIDAHGKYGFEVYVDGVKYGCYDDIHLPQFEWAHLQASVDVATGKIKLYKNGTLIHTTSFAGNNISVGGNDFIIGKNRLLSYYNAPNNQTYPMLDVKTYLNIINGFLDEIKVYSGIVDAPSQGIQSENIPDFSIPKERFQNEIQRPEFHAMPASAWTNEPHGFIYHNNKYHIWFQKNGNGPYWGRLHWGHLISEDLINFTEVEPSLAPDKYYDAKGCWTGCVYIDPILTNNKPRIYYTPVTTETASIAEAYPLDDNLIDWEKSEAPIIPHFPAGYSGDFRDPYIFKAHDKYWMIVGSSKDGKGIATLHEYNPVTQTWSNDGRSFFSTNDTNDGAIWECPTITPLNDGKWLFGVAPLYLSANEDPENSTQEFYWTGTINQDGTFEPLHSQRKEIELSGMSKHGYGMIMNTAMQKDGKTVIVGCVPDKLPGYNNYEHGWAHLYSFPREWSIDQNNDLVQAPYADILPALRKNADTFYRTNITLQDEALLLNPVNGMTAEMQATFVVTDNQQQVFGFRFRKSGSNYVELRFNPTTDTLTMDVTHCVRERNDNGNFNGLYKSIMPRNFIVGDTLKMHIFMDHSIWDVFLNDKWAFSFRAFPTVAGASDIEVFSETSTEIKNIKAWKINKNVKKPVGNKYKIAFINGEDEVTDDDELAAQQWFLNNCKGDYLPVSQITAEKLSDYVALWIISDREDATTMPQAMLTSEMKTIVGNWYKNGGNLLLTTYATQYLSELGRFSGEGMSINNNLQYDSYIQTFYGRSGTDGQGIWWGVPKTINHSLDPLFAGVLPYNWDDGNVWNGAFNGEDRCHAIPLITEHLPMENHNSWWTTDWAGFNNADTSKFTNIYNALKVTPLATLNNINDYFGAVIARWDSTGEYKGKAITIGSSHYEWHQEGNRYQSNIEQLTMNALLELTAGKDTISVFQSNGLKYDKRKITNISNERKNFAIYNDCDHCIATYTLSPNDFIYVNYLLPNSYTIKLEDGSSMDILVE